MFGFCERKGFPFEGKLSTQLTDEAGKQKSRVAISSPQREGKFRPVDTLEK
jgi:hypothetical protein